MVTAHQLHEASMSESIHSLANAFHAAAEQMRQAPKRHPMLAHLPEPTEDPIGQTTRKISADVLQAIGDVYFDLAAQDA